MAYALFLANPLEKREKSGNMNSSTLESPDLVTIGPKGGDHHRFESAVLPHLGAVRAFAISLVRETSGAEDLLQDTLIRALRGFESFKSGSNCRSWLFRICKNRFIDLCRMHKRRPFHEDVDVTQPRSPVISWEVEKEQQRLEKGADPCLDLLGDRVRAAITKLPDDFREPLLLCDLDGLGYQEIADKLSVPLGTVRSRISRARGRLRVELHDYARDNGFSTEKLPAA